MSTYTRMLQESWRPVALMGHAKLTNGGPVLVSSAGRNRPEKPYSNPYGCRKTWTCMEMWSISISSKYHFGFKHFFFKLWDLLAIKATGRKCWVSPWDPWPAGNPVATMTWKPCFSVASSAANLAAISALWPFTIDNHKKKNNNNSSNNSTNNNNGYVLI